MKKYLNKKSILAFLVALSALVAGAIANIDKVPDSILPDAPPASAPAADAGVQ